MHNPAAPIAPILDRLRRLSAMLAQAQAEATDLERTIQSQPAGLLEVPEGLIGIGIGGLTGGLIGVGGLIGREPDHSALRSAEALRRDALLAAWQQHRRREDDAAKVPWSPNSRRPRPWTIESLIAESERSQYGKVDRGDYGRWKRGELSRASKNLKANRTCAYDSP